MKQFFSSLKEHIDYAFQPILHIHTGKIYAVEALIRNTDKLENINSIDHLFDYAYEKNFLNELDLVLKDMAIKKFRNIPLSNLKLFFNIDNRVTNKNSSTFEILDKYNLPKETIYFELSERNTIQKDGTFQELINSYKESGINIAIDDFGIGVSGLKLLYYSEANIIKLDRFFISDIDKDSKKKLFCLSIIEMAHIMGIKVVAEGIETQKEFYTCLNLNVDFIQGYLIQKPTVNIGELRSEYENIKELIEKDKRKSLKTKIDSKYIQKIKPLNINSSLYELFVYFKENTKNTFVPIVNDFNNLVGVIYEVDIKKLSYSQYGLSLAKNHTYSKTLRKHIKECLSIEMTWGIDKTLELFNQSSHKSNGIFITQAGRYVGFMNLNSLLTLSYQRNIEIASNQNPLTKLPGNKQIEEFISSSFLNKDFDECYFIYFDFNDFKPFNDKYGFRQGDRAILIFSELIQKKYPKECLIAHIGGDDFFIGIKNISFHKIYELCLNSINEFKDSVKNIYSQEDKQKGYISTKDRFNIERNFNLLSTSCAIISINQNTTLENFDLEIGKIKKQSKKINIPLSVTINM